MISLSAERTATLIAVLGLARVSCSSPPASHLEDTPPTLTSADGATITTVFATAPEDAVTMTLPEQGAIGVGVASFLGQVIGPITATRLDLAHQLA